MTIKLNSISIKFNQIILQNVLQAARISLHNWKQAVNYLKPD